MWLYQFCYNNYPDSRLLFEELDILRKAVRLETVVVEQSIKKMADEFLNIDLFCRRLQDDYHPKDSESFRGYMQEFADQEVADMMNLKVKVQNALMFVRSTAAMYVYQLEDNKPESLFIIVQEFIDMMHVKCCVYHFILFLLFFLESKMRITFFLKIFLLFFLESKETVVKTRKRTAEIKDSP